MIDPTLTLTLLKRRTKAARVKKQFQFSVYDNNGLGSMTDAITELARHGRTEKDEYYLSFASYKSRHTKDDIQHMSAIPLSYPYSCKAELDAALSSLPYIHYVIHSQSETNSKAPEERIVVAFIPDSPITCPKEYTRIASILSEKIGVGSHSQGDFSATYLFALFTQICSVPKIVLNDVDREFLDPAAFIEEHRGVWTNARLLQEGAAPKPKAMTPDDTGLFVF